MNGLIKYIPVLRWRSAEKAALASLSDQRQRVVIPIIELVPPNIKDIGTDKTFQDRLNLQLNNFTSEIVRFWGNTFYLDVHLLGSEVQDRAIETIIGNCNILNINAIPILNLSNSKITSLLKVNPQFRANGIALRIYGNEIGDDFNQVIENLLSELEIEIEMLDLIVDLGMLDDRNYNLDDIFSQIEKLDSLRDFTLLSGYFPLDLTEYKNPRKYYRERKDWKLWLSYTENTSYRKPNYGDYTIQHPKFHIPKGNPLNISASIKYTIKDDWVIMKGQGVNTPGSTGRIQYIANAMVLVSSDEFMGQGYSRGDCFIYKKSLNPNTKHFGVPADWLKAGINHHMSVVADQLSNLS